MNPAYLLLSFAMVLVNAAFALAQPAKSDVCPRDADGFAAVQRRAEANDAAAQTALASCYDLGQHVQPDGKQSIHWLTEAAGQGYAQAQYELGRIYLYGRGVPADYDKALLWERKAADQGDARAQRDLAFMYERGLGVSADPAQAAEWNRKAANQGHPEAQLQLAKALDHATGVKEDAGEARQWYAKAARQEQPAAQLELARESADQGNCPVAVHWYEEAAGHGEAQAMYELGKLYLNRCGPNKDLAFTWFTIGARFGLRESKAEADKLVSMLSAARKKRDQLRVAEWIKEHPGSDKEEDKEEKR
ncbi:MAG TPA: tetratricopeptide repeat protein [Candidatus Sulfotelmatobacter sp.]|nr:tetratricopeptide repeat protein [Candidatus Sulfotelmatobacter sp.]